MSNIDIKTRTSIADSQFSSQKKYWLNQLSGNLVRTGFPPDIKSTGNDRTSYRDKSFTIEGEFYSWLMKLSNGSDTRLYVVMLTILIILLHKYTGSEDIIVGTTIAKQDRKETFINTILALRMSPGPHTAFKELLLHAYQMVIQASENQNYPIDSLLSHLGPAESGKDFSPFGVCILSANIHEKEYLRHIRPDITFSFLREANRIQGNLEYAAALYREETIEAIIKRYNGLLCQAKADIAKRVTDFNLLEEEERKQILYEFNDLDAGYKGSETISSSFARQCRVSAQQIALVALNGQLTYGELNARANRTARLLKKNRVAFDEVVGVVMDRTLELIIGILGILKAGAAYLPIPPDTPVKRVRFMLQDGSVKWVLTLESLIEAGKNDFPCQVVNLDTETLKQHPPHNLPEVNTPGSLAYLIYTSGSTGKPKGVAMTHRGVNNLVLGLRETVYARYAGALHISLLAPIEFDASVQQVFGALLQGHRLFITPGEIRKDTTRLMPFYNRMIIDISDGTPTHIRMMVDCVDSLLTQSNHLLIYIKHFIIAGEELPKNLVEKFFRQHPDACFRISNFYGPTETCVDSTYFHISREKLHLLDFIPIGKPLPNENALIMDSQCKELQPVGVIGELCIGGDGAARGYLNRPELTAEKFNHDLWDYLDNLDKKKKINKKFLEVQEPFFKKVPGRRRQRVYKTGDLARWLPDGNIKFQGRRDTQVKIRGIRIELEEIEKHLRAYPDITDVVVTAREQPGGSSILCAYYLAPREFTVNELREFLSQQLTDYMIPSYFTRIDRLPVTGNGKVDREALPEPSRNLTPEAKYAPPRSSLEKELCEIWQNLLEIERIGITDNFFDVGGDSINAIGIVNTCNNRLNARLVIADLYTHQTIQKLSEHIMQNDNTDKTNEKNIHNTHNEILTEMEALKNRILQEL